METTTALMDDTQQLTCSPNHDKAREMNAVLSQYLSSFYRHAFRYLGNAADAEDAVQDALLSAYRHLEQFRGQAKMSTWLTTIVINSARVQLRRRPRHLYVSLDEQSRGQEGYPLSEMLPDHQPDPEEVFRSAEFEERFVQLARQLSPILRRVFYLHDIDGLSIREIADILAVPEGAVKTRIYRARARLRALAQRSKGDNMILAAVACAPAATKSSVREMN
jgi:RNA polymerase sigma-70 factor, ECF subfamily